MIVCRMEGMTLGGTLKRMENRVWTVLVVATKVAEVVDLQGLRQQIVERVSVFVKEKGPFPSECSVRQTDRVGDALRHR